MIIFTAVASRSTEIDIDPVPAHHITPQLPPRWPAHPHVTARERACARSGGSGHGGVCGIREKRRCVGRAITEMLQKKRRR